MKLFLSSNNIPDVLVSSFKELVEKPLERITFALIENAADPYPEEKKGFVQEARTRFKSAGLTVQPIDLREYVGRSDALRETLSSYDVIWLGGGNVFYLRWLLRESGLDLLLPDLLEKGIVYGGESAGSVVAGPSLAEFDKADDPSKAKEIVLDGLGLTDVVIVPHWGNEKYAAVLNEIKEYYESTEYPVVAITDEQAVVVRDGVWKTHP